MLNRLLVPLDGSACAECALLHTSVIARAFQSTVTLLHVLDPDQLKSSVGSVDPLQWQVEKSEAAMYLGYTAKRLGGLDVQVQTEIRQGCVPERINELASGYDLTILCSHGQSGLSVWPMGSVAQKVVLSTGASTLLARADQTVSETPREFSYRRILVPLDGSWRAEAVLPVATVLAQACNAQLLLAHVVCEPEMVRRLPPSDAESSLVRQLAEHNQRSVAIYLDELAQRLPVRPQIHLLQAKSARAALHNLVEQEGVDLVMLCAHGYSGDYRCQYGSVATSLITYGTSSLFIMQDMPGKQTVAQVTQIRAHEIPGNV